MRLSIIIFSLLLAVSLHQGANPPNRAVQTGDTSDKSKEKLKQLPSSTDSLNTGTSAPHENYQQTNISNPRDSTIHLDSYLTAFATAVIAFFTYLTWRIYVAQLRTTKLTERAWLVPDIGNIEKTPKDGTFQVIVSFRNNGKTPARVTAAGSNGWCETKQRPLPQTPTYTLMGPFSKEGQLLPPTAFLPQGINLEQIHIDLAIREEAFIYMFGFVEYRDVYGDAHFTRYCYQAKSSLDLNHPKPLDFYVSGPEAYLGAD